MNITILRGIVYCLLLVQLCFAQEQGFKIPDSLEGKTFKVLAKDFYKREHDSAQAYPYAMTYLLKAKKKNDSIKIADGFYFLSSINRDSTLLRYCDSMIVYTMKNQNKFYPALPYSIKANYYYSKRKFSKSLENYLAANKAAINNNYLEILYVIKHRIGLLKSRYGEDEEALAIFKEVYSYYEENNYLKNDSFHYFIVLFALADSYCRNKKLDSATFYNNKGYKESLEIGDTLHLNYFVFEQGLVAFENENYSAAIDSINKALPQIIKNQDLPNIAHANYCIGRSYEKLYHKEKAINYFKVVDSVYQILNDIHPDLRDSYETLIDYYKAINKPQKQLEYIEKLLHVDSTLNSNYRIVSRKLSKEYDTPKLLEQKNNVIKDLESSLNTSTKWIWVFSGALVLLSVFLINQYKKRKRYKRRFEELIKDSNHSIEKNTSESPSKVKTDVPGEILSKILESLRKFEENEGYLKKDVQLNTLAKKIKTNAKYLSITINSHKQKNFSTYLNDLRIDYAINKLKTDKKFRIYTVKAIAKEIGFNSAESFSKTFRKKTGLYPSYFINELIKSDISI